MSKKTRDGNQTSSHGGMSKVTRVVYSYKLNKGKYVELSKIARRLGKLRTEGGSAAAR